jgi:hypothetical protein
MIGFNLHFSVFFTPEQPAGRAYPGRDSILLFGAVWVLLGNVFGVVNQIIIMLLRENEKGISVPCPHFLGI